MMKFNLSKIQKPNLDNIKGKIKKPNFSLKRRNNFSIISNLNISKRDFILLGIFLLALEGYVLFSFLLIPKWQQYSNQHTHYNSQKTLAMSLEKDNANKAQYQETLSQSKFKLDRLTMELPPNVAQEDIVLSLNKLANDQKLSINTISFGNISSVSKEVFATGKIPSGNTTPNNGGGIVLTEDIDIDFSGSYGALYNFMSSLEKSNRKIITNNITMTRGDGSILKGQLKIQFVGYKGPDDQGIFKLETPQTSGKSSPFLAYPGYDDKATGSPVASASTPAPTSAPVKTFDPNFYLILNTSDDNAPKVIMGVYTNAGSELYDNANGKVSGKLSISGNLDKMTYSYSLGGSTQTKEAKLVLDGGELRLHVSSQQRKNATDKVGIILDVDNKTDYPLEINVINDDKNDPRFSIGNKSGSVIIK